ncbi:MAG: right-handed parallel beta-helix repeat-containing protein [Chitinophagales bacterium]|nr:right-handed parallel beta-helix repeat-containing protein [Chitinophagales bacterium]
MKNISIGNYRLDCVINLIINKNSLVQFFKSFIVIAYLFSGQVNAQSIIYVDSAKASSGAGTSWSTAYKTLKEATQAANSNLSIKEIRIAKGTYFPTTNTNRDSTFLISRGDIRLYGGYPNGGGTRSPSSNPTILSGDIGAKGTLTDNSYHVMVVAGLVSGADSVIIDGLNIRLGRADASNNVNYNGQNIPRSYGGGIAIKGNANADKIIIKNTIISGNYASNNGAGINVESTIPVFLNCLFSGNYADYGGAAFNYLNAHTRYINCTFAGNHDNHSGGAMRNSSSNPIITNCIIYGNDGGISNNSSTPAITYSLVQELSDVSNGNIIGTSNPSFVSPIPPGTVNIDGDYSLQMGSLCINKGNNSALNGINTDLAGNIRIHNGQVEMGAYEFVFCPTFQIVYVDSSISVSGDGSSWNNAFKTLAEATARQACSNIKEIHVAKGTYYPTGTQVAFNRDSTFLITRGDIKIFGGYPSGGGVRNSSEYPNILSGDIAGTNNISDNSYHVMTISGIGNSEDSIIIDGFKFIGANANGSGTKNFNGANIARNDGGGLMIWNVLNGNKTQVRNCIFSSNRAEDAGGAIYTENSTPLYVNLLVSGNLANYGGGLALVNASHAKLINCTIAGNRCGSSGAGGAMRNSSSNPTIINTIIYDNNSGISNNSSTPIISYSLVQGITSIANGNLNGNLSNPNFILPIDYAQAPNILGDYRLQAGSVCINKGNNIDVPSFISSDLDGNERIYLGTVEMGAYEFLNCPNFEYVYVDSSVAVSGNGVTWANAFKTLSEALELIHCYNIKEIRIAKGTYYPTGLQNGTNKDSTFLITRGGIKILGGYPSGGGIRNAVSNKTILSGDIGTLNSNIDNSYHIMMIAGIDSDADSILIDGLNFQWANANASGTKIYNGQTIDRNDGGGLVIWNALNGGKVQISNCSFSANRAADGGAGMYITNSTPLIINSLFSGNHANFGGGVVNYSNAHAQFVNCTFSGNRAGDSGGAMRNSSSNPTFINTIVYGNNSGISNNSSVPIISYSLIQGLTATTNGNLNGNISNPYFIFPINASFAPTLDGDYRIQSLGEGINAGINSAVPSNFATDLYGNTRIYSGTVDLGAFEVSCTNAISLYVDSNKTISGNGESWASAYKTLSEAIARAQFCPSIQNIYVAKGTYFPSSVNDPDGTFLITRGNLKILGAYPSGGGVRNASANKTILSGDIGTRDLDTDNSYHIMTIAGLSNSADSLIIDGFQFVWGKAVGSGTKTYNTFNIPRNAGGGLVLWSNANGANIQVRNCIFSANRADDIGGAFYSSASSATVVNSLFSGNLANYGGAMSNINSSDTRVVNCTFSGNRAGQSGGAMRNSNSNPTLINSIIFGNNSAISNNSSTTNISYSLVQDFSGTSSGNIDVAGNLYGTSYNPSFIYEINPSWAPTVLGNFNVNLISPVINAGTTTAENNASSFDLSDNPRISDANIDMGAYENSCFVPTTIYVDSSNTISGNGSTWYSALPTLTEALALAQSCSQINTILIAKGTYFPLTQTDRDATFLISRGNLRLIGGYPSGGGERNLNTNPTILSGDIGTKNNNTDNSYHVLMIAGLGTSADSVVIDGLQIFYGRADGGGSKVFNGQTINRSDGGGLVLLNNQNGSKVQIRNVIISANYASNLGAGILNQALSNISPSTSFYNVLVSGNHANYGGGIANVNASPTYVNATIVGNRAGNTGGGMRNSNAFPQLKNTILYGNSNGISEASASVTTAEYSLIQGFTNVTNGNFNGNTTNPNFNFLADYNLAPTLSGDYRVQAGSPVLDKGLNSSVPYNLYQDVVGKPRIYNSKIDLGAYELGCLSNSTIYVDSSMTGSGDGYSWATALPTLNEALVLANSCKEIKTILVAKGTYYPTAFLDRDASFIITRGDLRIYGGYSSGGTTRNIVANRTILSGDIGTKGSNTDNSYHVMIAAGIGAEEDSLVIDGLSILWGNANGSSTKLFNQQSIPRNNAGGLALWNSSNGDKIIIKNCIISANKAEDAGGGVYNINSSATYLNCLVTGNLADYGGAFANVQSSNVKLINNTIASNRSNHGSAMRNSNSNPTIINTIIYYNSDGTISNNGTSIPQISYSLVQDKFVDTDSNINGNSNPNLSAPASYSSAPTDGGEYTLLDNSPVINKGINTAYTEVGGSAVFNTDLANNIRVYDYNYDGRIEIGAYEYIQDDLGSAIIGVIRYVKENASGNGTSWANASGDLQAMINISNRNDQIWVAAGTYYPNRRIQEIGIVTPNNRDNAFLLKTGVSIFGGFAGFETVLNDRNSELNPTILSGDFNNNDGFSINQDSLISYTNNSENAYHVIVSAGNGKLSLNDFIIKGGNANGSGEVKINNLNISRIVGGLFAGSAAQDINFNNCQFQKGFANHTGGAIDIENGQNIRISHCDIRYNRANHGGGISFRNTNEKQYYYIENSKISVNNANKDGGGVFCRSGKTYLLNSVVSGNTAISNVGGGIYAYRQEGGSNGRLEMINCLITGNVAASEGGGLRVASYVEENFDGSHAENDEDLRITTWLYNCTFSGNRAGNGGAIYRHHEGASVDIRNCILWGNSSSIKGGEKNIKAYNSIIEGGYNGSNINYLDPWFVNAPSYSIAPFSIGDYSVLACSYSINKGSEKSVNILNNDINGNPRIVGGKIDLGAYESQVEAPQKNYKYVKQGGTGDGSSWANASGDLQDMINKSGCSDNIFVAKGTYYPIRKANNLNLITTLDRDNAFVLKNGVNLYGGFEGFETDISQRDLSNPNNASVLSGDFMNNDSVSIDAQGVLSFHNNQENAYHVVVLSNLLGVNLDGFTIKGGNANNTNDISVNSRTIGRNSGGGIVINSSINILLVNCLIENNLATNQGGGAFFYASKNYNLKKVIVHQNIATYGGGIMSRNEEYSDNSNYDECIISSNNAINEGGGISIKSGTSYVVNTKIVGNQSITSSGGGAYAYRLSHSSSAYAYFINCQITGNKAATSGGGLRVARHYDNSYGSDDYHAEGTFYVYNSTISGNSAASGGAVDVYSYGAATNEAKLYIKNSIVWGNSSFIYINRSKVYTNFSLLEGQRDGTSNQFEAPLFVNAPSYTEAPFNYGDYTLNPCSPAINTGNNSLNNIPQIDILGNNRYIGRIDKGVIEYQGGKIISGTKWYVKSGQSGDGSSWSTAAGDLQAIINNASCGDTIFVAKGIYIPNRKSNQLDIITPNDRDNAFVLRSNVSIYGGFVGNESDISQRDLANPLNQSILSGDFLGNDQINPDANGLPEFTNNNENAFHVVVLSNVTNSTLDGFVINGGRANGSNSLKVAGVNIIRNNGAGLIIKNAYNTKINNCIFQKSHASDNGGAIYSEDSEISIIKSKAINNKADYGGAFGFNAGVPIVSNCIIEKNRAYQKGGGIYTTKNNILIESDTLISNQAQEGGAVFANESVNTQLKYCRISGNRATDGGGGGIYNGSTSNLQVLQSLITGNLSSKSGAAIRNNNTATIIGCTIAGNKSTDGVGGIRNENDKAQLVQNCIIYGNNLGVSGAGDYKYSLVQSGATGNTVYKGNPLFVDLPSDTTAPFITGDFHTFGCWPIINNGSIEDISQYIPNEDFDGNPRIKNDFIDLGVYETEVSSKITYVKVGGSGDKSGSSWANAMGDLQLAINIACTGDSIFVAQGTYIPNRSVSNIGTISLGNRDNAFLLKNNVKIFGGFNGTETSLSDRSTIYETKLSGKLGEGIYAYHVVAGINVENIVLDGFSIMEGKADNGNSININGSAINRHNGGGLLLENTRNAKLLNLNISNNYAANDGGGVAIHFSNIQMENCSIQNNKVKVAGGGIRLRAVDGSVNKLIVSNNYAIDTTEIINIGPISDTSFAGEGGGLFIELHNQQLTISNLTATNNIAGDNGGGMKVSETNLTCYSCKISNNRARDGSGGGVFSMGGAQLKLYDIELLNNQADNNGGGIWSGRQNADGEIADLYINKGLIQGNSTNENGGGIYTYWSINDKLFYVKILENSANRGGGIANLRVDNEFDGTTIGIYNSLIARNIVIEDGGGIYNNHSTKSVIVSSTITANTAKNGGGIYNDSEKCPPIPNNKYYHCSDDKSTSNIKNSIVWGNTVTNNGVAIYEGTSSSKSSIESSFIEGNNNWDNGNINTAYITPEFKDMTIGDYTLTAISPCVNSGNNSFQDGSVDLSGEKRIAFSYIDMGAYEYQQSANQENIRFVRQGATGDGLTWDRASGNIQAMVNTPGVRQVWVAEGTYIPEGNGFILKNKVTLYGGFPSTGEPGLNSRNWDIYPTILSGNHVGRVVYNNFSINDSLNSTAVLNGFVITNGNTTGNGAGMYNNNASPRIENVTFTDNHATGGLGGGAVYNSLSNPIFKNCIFKQNTATSNGGAIFNEQSNPLIINGLIFSNTATEGSAIAAISNSSYQLVNTTISKNISTAGDVLVNDGTNAQPKIFNSIIYSNPDINNNFTFNIVKDQNGAHTTAQNSLIQFGFPGTGNLSTDPLFLNPELDDFTLQEISPAINNGNNLSYSITGQILEADLDLKQQSRLIDSIVDMGAYELKVDIVPIRYVKVGGSGNGKSWADASGNLQSMIDARGVEEVWVAAGTYNSPANGFRLRNNVKVYGAFPSIGNPALVDRNVQSNTTILSGETTRRIVNNNFDSLPELNTSAVLDGFTLKDGYTDENGAAINNFNASPTLSNLIFLNNSSLVNGGAIYNLQSNPIIEKCQFISNSADIYGGAIANFSSKPTISNSLFIQNSSPAGGAIFAANGSSYKTINSTFSQNISPLGTFYHFGSMTQPQIYNCIIYGNSTAIVEEDTAIAIKLFNVIQGDNSDSLNYNFDPLFVNPGLGDFSLQIGSPAINQGNNLLITNGSEEIEMLQDLNQQSRIYDYFNNGIVDLGAYEYQGTPSFPIRYVKKDGIGNGTSWGNASGSLQAMIDAKDVQQVWVAQGTYISENDGWRLKNNVAILGGFPNTENPQIEDRNWNQYPTILSGNQQKRIFNHTGILVNEEEEGADSTIVLIIDSTAILDGFVLTQGFSEGNGAAMYNQFASPTLRNLVFVNNHSGQNGAAIYNVLSRPKVFNSKFSNNTAIGYGGAIVNDFYSEMKVFNSTFFGNTAQIGSVYFSSDSSKLTLVNCTMEGNVSIQDAGALFSLGEGANTQVYNSILFNNDRNILDSLGAQTLISNSLVEGGFVGTGNIDTDPLFVDAAQNNYTLQESSPAINLGDNTLYQNEGGNLQNDKDLAIQSRVYNYASSGKIDIGAYEYQGNPKYPIRYVRQNATGSGTSWGTASGDMQAMINSSEVQQVWVAEGKYLSVVNGFVLKNGVKVLGGFASDGRPTIEERNPFNYNSILSGNNERRVFNNNFSPSTKLTNSAVLDGFTITEGNLNINGAGMFNANASPILRNLIFINNHSGTGNGGAMYNAASNPLIVNCKFFENSSLNNGGAVCNASGSIPIIVNCLFVENVASNGGGAIFANNASSYQLINSTIYNNNANIGGGLNHAGSTTMPSVKNSIIYGNSQQIVNSSSAITTVDYSLVQDGYAGNHNLQEDPAFENVNDNNFNLSLGSPAINTADLLSFPDSISLDLNGNNRLEQNLLDMGAYENKGFILANKASDTIVSNHSIPNEEGWIHYYKSDDSTLVLSLNSQNQFLGVVETNSILNDNFGKGTIGLITPYGQIKNVYPANRSWTVHTSESFTQPVKVRFYFSDIDSMDIMQTMPFTTKEQLVAYKVNGDDVWDTSSNGFIEYALDTIADTLTYVFGSFQGNQYVEFMVNSFSSGTIAMSLDESILPLDLISFTATLVNDKTQLQWNTVNEVNVSHFEIERSLDGIHWEKISGTNAQNGIAQQYMAWDYAPYVGINYYRLKMIDIDGSIKYSKIVQVSLIETKSEIEFSVFPNPSNGDFTITAKGMLGPTAKIQIYDESGKVIFNHQIIEGNNPIHLGLLPSGAYLLKIKGEQETHVQKLIIE